MNTCNPRRRMLFTLITAGLVTAACGGGNNPANVTPVATNKSANAGATNFSITSPATNSSTPTKFSVIGAAGTNWVNIGIWDHTTNTKVGIDGAPSNGTFTIAVDMGSLTGMRTLDVIAFSVAAGQPGGTSTLLSLPLTITAQQYFYGMNGHPVQGGIYASRTPAQQMADLHDLGCTVYRLDCYGTTANAKTLLAFAVAGASLGIMTLPVLAFNSALATTNETDNYNIAFTYGANTATVLKGYCPIYEVTNEICDYVKPNTSVTGEHASDYDEARFLLVRGLIRGLIAGLRSVQPQAQIVIGGGVTIETAFFNMLWNGIEPNGTTNQATVRWNYTGWHWYESSGNPTTAYDGTGTPLNVLANLKQYGVPVWFTELGFVPTDSPTAQSNYCTSALTSFLGWKPASSYNIMNACWYELYDAGGTTYGLIQGDGVTHKPCYATYKNFTASHQV